MASTMPLWICADTQRPHVFSPDHEYDADRPPMSCESCGELKHGKTTVPRLSDPQRSLLGILQKYGAQDILTEYGRRTAQALVRRGLAHWWDPHHIRLVLGFAPSKATPCAS